MAGSATLFFQGDIHPDIAQERPVAHRIDRTDVSPPHLLVATIPPARLVVLLDDRAHKVDPFQRILMITHIFDNLSVDKIRVITNTTQTFHRFSLPNASFANSFILRSATFANAMGRKEGLIEKMDEQRETARQAQRCRICRRPEDTHPAPGRTHRRPCRGTIKNDDARSGNARSGVVALNADGFSK